MDNEYYEKRLKKIEETLAWMQKDFELLINKVQNIQPEIHYHLTNITENIICEDCDENDLFNN